MLLAAGERGLDVIKHMAKLIADPRNPAFVTHSLTDILWACMLAITCGYEDVGDLDHPDALSVNLQIALANNLGL